MAKPTKEECSDLIGLLAADLRGDYTLDRADTQRLLRWLLRVEAALPSAAAVQRDRERRKVSRHFDRPGTSRTEGEAISEDGR